MADLVKARTSILDHAYSYLSPKKGVSGIFLSGSLADKSADCHSDIDLRVVVEDQHFFELTNERENAPINWGEFLFHETIGPNCTVSYYKPFNKIDLFYYKASEFGPSPWLNLPIDILLDKGNAISVVVNQSKSLNFNISDGDFLNLNRKAVAIISEVIKRIARDEYLYAHKMMTDLVEVVLNINDHLDSSPPLGSVKFMNRKESAIKSELLSLSFARENQISDLKILTRIVAKNIEATSTENLPLALKIASNQLDELSRSRNLDH